MVRDSKNFFKYFAVPENSTYRPRPREGLGRTPELGRLPILRTSVDLPETADFRAQYFCGAAIQSPKQLLLLLLLPNCPPHYILLILSYLELKVHLEREIEREERKI